MTGLQRRSGLLEDRPGQRVDAWNSGQVEVATSALMLAEVLYVLVEPSTDREVIDRAREPDIIDLFAPHGARRLKLIEVDRSRAEGARQVFWDHGIRPKDAIHVASALSAKCPVMFSRDGKLIAASGNVGGVPPLIIKPAQWTSQEVLGIVL